MNNNTMNYDEFKAYVINNIPFYLGAEYVNARINVTKIEKAGFAYDGLMISNRKEGAEAVPALNLDGAYEDYKKGEDIHTILMNLAQVRKTHEGKEIDKDLLLDADKAIKRLFPRLINFENNADYLFGKLYKRVCDLALLLEVRLFEDEHSLMSCAVTNDLAELWGIQDEDLFAYAMENLSCTPPTFIALEEIVDGDPCDMRSLKARPICEVDIDDYTAPFFVLSSINGQKGATFIIVPEVMEQVTDLLGDVYIIPSSVNDVIVVPKEAGIPVEVLKGMVNDVNVEAVEPEDQLSDNIYAYDSESKTIVIAE